MLESDRWALCELGFVFYSVASTLPSSTVGFIELGQNLSTLPFYGLRHFSDIDWICMTQIKTKGGFFESLLFSNGRLSKYLRGLVTGYGSLVAVFISTAVTVPLGISELRLEGWGIWVFCQQASALICLFESFTQSAFVRLLIQVKDDPSSEDYKKMVWMGRWSFWLQGLLLLAAHGALAAALPLLFPNFSGTDGWMTICIMGLASLINQAGKINGQLLYAHQHQDRASLAATAGLLVNLLAVIVYLPRHPSAATMAWAFLAGSLAGQIMYWGFARLSKCLPSFPGTPSIRLSDFQPLWFWGKRFFLYSFFDNLSGNLPTILAGRFLTLETLGAWGVLQRIANMMSQAIQKLPQLAVPALMEMHARGEESRFYKRSGQILLIQNFLAAATLGILSVWGDFFLKVWLGKELPLGHWILPIFCIGLLLDFDQRIRYSFDSIRLHLKRPTAAACLKTFFILLGLPILIHSFGLIGMAAGLAALYGMILWPLAFVRNLFPGSFYLSVRPTLIGFSTFFLFLVCGLILKMWFFYFSA